ncbi:hypothetical protein [Psychromonas ossibalaenae]|uniref:hypothetical protein n=1 Tax=Psychromonas ossibalaenae TaxID=444922 RepID=UPI0003715134|nr:hypothetical protein [Psychromonas ossibalaenae]
MYTIIYQWEVHSHKCDEFLNAWEAVTEHYMENHNALGSRLHKAGENYFVAYSQWLNKEARDAAFSKNDAPQEAITTMEDSIINTHRAIEMDVLSDKLVNT